MTLIDQLKGQNPFEILQIDYTTDDDAIRAAFRRLVKGKHPDHDRTPGAAERFNLLLVAKKACLDPDIRASFMDRKPTRQTVSSSFDGFFDAVKNGRGTEIRAPRHRRGADVERDLEITLEQSYAGGHFSIGDAPGPCLACNSKGRYRVAQKQPCPDCSGQGRSRRVKGIVSVEVECPTCEGTGTTNIVICPACGGAGQARPAPEIITLPESVRDGMQIRLEHQGAPGVGRGLAGDLIITIRVAPHPLFRRAGVHLETSIEIQVWEAALGTTRELAGIDGSLVRLKIPPGTQPETLLTVKGHGMHAFSGRGDLHVLVRVRIPTPGDGPLRELFQKMASIAEVPGQRGDSQKGRRDGP